jgi:monoamine oxidase
METTTLSLGQVVSLVQEKKEFNLEQYKESDRELIRQVAPFYLHLLECWYGTQAANLQLCEFVKDQDQGCKFSKDPDQGDEYIPTGDFYGPHCVPKGGMKTVLETLQSDQVLLNQQVLKFRHTDKGVVLETNTGLTVHSEICVSTIPLGSLDTKLFEPKLSDCKLNALSSVCMGTYKKVLLIFDRIFWPVDQATMLGMVRASSDRLGNFLLFNNYRAKEGLPCIEAVLFGESGEWATHKSDSEIVQAVLEFMADALRQDNIQEYYKDCRITRWEEDPLCQGAYAAVALGATLQDLEELNRPEWDGSLVFAGDATILEFEGSVHAALMSGENAAKKVNSFLRQS